LIVLLKLDAPDGALVEITRAASRLGLPSRSLGGGRRAVEVEGPIPAEAARLFRTLPHVEAILERASPYPNAALEGEGTRPVRVGQVEVGGQDLVLFAGPCAVESEEQIHQAAAAAAQAGASLLRGGAYKPRTRPSDFQGVGLTGLKWLRQAADRQGLLVVTEALDEAGCWEVAEWADLLQIGARTMQATSLLETAAKTGKPVLLKRGMAATVDEWLSAAEYLLDGGCPGVILCERGSRTFEGATRFSLDVGAIAAAKLRTHLPVVADPSHPAGRRALVLPLARAAIAAGADGLLVEAHPDPACARCDGPQALLLEDLATLAMDLEGLGGVLGRGYGSRRSRLAVGS
jgi:3-deoxy-7-phosphoheptulonate synthase